MVSSVRSRRGPREQEEGAGGERWAASLHLCSSGERRGQVASSGFEFSAHKGLEPTSAGCFLVFER